MNLSPGMFVRLLITTLIMFSYPGRNEVLAQHKVPYNPMLRTIQQYRTPKQNAFFIFISKWNNPVCIAAPASLLTVGMANHDKVLRKKALYVAESIVCAESIDFSLKFAIGRVRPAKVDTSFKELIKAENQAFPSGHTGEVFAMATAMSVAVPKWYVIVPAYAWAALIAYSRMYLGIHYPGDILAGAFIGAGSGYLMYKLNKRMQQDFKGHHPANEITGLFVGLSTSYLIYQVNKWIQKGKIKRRGTFY